LEGRTALQLYFVLSVGRFYYRGNLLDHLLSVYNRVDLQLNTKEGLAYFLFHGRTFLTQFQRGVPINAPATKTNTVKNTVPKIPLNGSGILLLLYLFTRKVFMMISFPIHNQIHSGLD